MWSASTLVAHQPSGLCKTKYLTQTSPFAGQEYRDSHDLGAGTAFQLSHRLDHLAKGVALRSFAPNSPDRTGYKAPIVPSPIQPGATPPPYGMIVPFSGSKNLHNGQTEPGDLYSQKSLGRFVTFLVKSKNLNPMKARKKSVRPKELNYLIDSHLCRCAKITRLSSSRWTSSSCSSCSGSNGADRRWHQESSQNVLYNTYHQYNMCMYIYIVNWWRPIQSSSQLKYPMWCPIT